MSKIWAALKVIWELWPYIKLLFTTVDSELLLRRIRKSKKDIGEVFKKLSSPEVSDEKAKKQIERFNDTFRT